VVGKITLRHHLPVGMLHYRRAGDEIFVSDSRSRTLNPQCHAP
jgi:hypothetical protein